VLETICVLLGAQIALTIVSCIGSEPHHYADQDCEPRPGGDQLRL
jgi:hypothetical protein